MERVRCRWAGDDPLMIAYHDREWGVPTHDDRVLFEFLLLEGAQAGLSWRTILHKREHYRRAFAGFDAAKVARFDDARLATLLADPGLVRNRAKLASALTNARAFLEVQAELSSFDRLVWGFVGGRPIRTVWRTEREVPARTRESDALSAELRRRGFKFVGSTICYAFMQACGLAIDHVEACFRARRSASARRQSG